MFSYFREIAKINLSTGFSDSEGKEGSVDWFEKRGGSPNSDSVVPLPAKVLILLSPERPGTSLSSPLTASGDQAEEQGPGAWSRGGWAVQG